VERYDLLTGDRLRFGDGVAPARALRRLNAAAARIGRLDGAQRGLATLTRARLAALTAPTRGDEALAAALARYSSTATAEVELEPPARKRLVAPPARTGIGRGEPMPPARRVPSSVVFARSQKPAVRGRSSARAAKTRAALIRTGEPGALPFGRQLGGPSADLPLAAASAGFEAVERVRGLEWLAARVPGGAEASESTLVTGMPAVQSSTSASKASVEATTASAMPSPAPALSAKARSLAGPVDVEQVPEPSVSPLPPVLFLPAGGHSGARGLEALVRAWADAEHSSPTSPTTEVSTHAASAGGETVSPEATHRGPPPRSSHALLPEHEALAFGDALGRVLVAELRRYGIEVDV
jgi:hypothetical protein